MPLPRARKAFEALGQALQSGDLAGAQSAFAQIQHAPSAAPTSGNLLTPAFVVNINTNQSQNTNQAQPNNAHQDYFQQRKADLAQLGTALQSPTSDSTQAAQQAYDALVALGQSGPFKNGATFRRADRAQDFAAIGQALASGDLAGAQQAFAALESTFHNHQQQPLGPPTPAPAPTTVASVPPEIVINLEGNNDSTGQLTIDVNQQSNGGEQISINLNPGTNKYQLVLSELQSASTTAAAKNSVSLQA